MATFSIVFYARDSYADSKRIYDCAEDLEILNARLLGRADDLSGSFDSAATQFTDVIAWDIQTLNEEDLQNWRDAAVSVTYAASVTEMWADIVDAFHKERDDQLSTWDGRKTEKENAVPAKYQGDRITESYPEADGFLWTDMGAGDERKCRDLYEELDTVAEGLRTREDDNWQALEDGAEDIKTMLEEGPTPENVRKLMEAGNASWAFVNLDPSRYSELLEDRDLSLENAEEYADELADYWSGDKPLDERYHELMLVLSMVGTNARQSQENGTKLSDEEMAFLEEFYAQLEEPYLSDGAGAGIMVYPDLMDESDMSDQEREDALGMLGDGLLVLSDPELGGGYNELPQSFRYAVEGSWINPDAEDKLPSLPVGSDMKALSAFMEHTDDNLQGGYGLSTNLHLTTGAFLDAWGDESDPDGVLPSSEQVSHLVDVASRNTDANYYMLTGEHRNEEEGVDYGDADLRTQALEGTLTYNWHDGGHTARQLTDWLAEDIHSDDPDVSQRAGDAFAGFMETITDSDMHEALVNTGVDVHEGDNEYSDASFTQVNGELADSLADIFDAHIYSFANGEVLDGENVPNSGIGEFDPEQSFVEMGPDERAMYMQLLMGDDETAGRVVNSVDAYQQVESIAFLETGNEASTARGSAQLQGLLERALWLESENRVADLDEDVDRRTQIAEFVVSGAGDLSEKIPVIGTAVSKGLGLGEESIVNAVIDGDHEVSPRYPVYTSDTSIQREFRMETLDYLAQSNSQEFQDDTQRGDFRTLVDSGVVTIERDGQALGASDITNDFTFDDNVTVSVAKETDWSEFDGDGLSSVDDALSGIMGTTHISAEYVDPHGETVERDGPGNDWVEDFTGEYTSYYDQTREYFNGDVEGFRDQNEDSEE
ncbi:TPR repeat region-containing protein [Nocardiopsis xinjiangensis]|uniref:TPR repeat region-containing protein n=1 Tax=Nocardiopsis xinjiangensis TaxID=124285 RepID=UPI000344A99F|nr:hypothetical protein [Nocardiopsis xinjiangensis]